MTTTAGLPADLQPYLDAVRAVLADVSAEEREDLLTEVEASLLETAAESDEPIHARLGPPDAFAAELRASAGLAAAPPGPAPRRGTLARARALAAASPPTSASAAPTARCASWRRSGGPPGPTWSSPSPPAWREPREPGPPHAAAPRQQLGHRRRAGRGPRRLDRAWPPRPPPADVVAAVPDRGQRAAGARRHPGAQHLADPTPLRLEPVYVAAPPSPAEGITHDGYAITNVYPYRRDGTPLFDVLLYDQNGVPIDVLPGMDDPDRRYLVDARGDRLLNAVPIRYFEPGTSRVARPHAAPPIRRPTVLTPPLRRAAP